MEANNITLDLNGHTVTYAASNQKHPVFGVLSADCWYAPVAGNPCGGHHRHIEIMNGKIVQGPGAATMSHAIRMGQGIDFSGVSIHGVDITISAQDSSGIYMEYLPGGSDIYGNTIHNNVKVISNRMQFYGASIKLDGEGQAKIPDLIHDNRIIGGPQLGIRDTNPAGTRIYRNNISQDATYANGFCIDAAGNNMLVYQNDCHPIHGRGIHVNHSYVRVFDNTVDTVDSNRISEYKGCEIHGTYGIQVESDIYEPQHVRIYNNHVVVHAAQCGADAMRLTDIKTNSIEIYGNTFIAVQDRIGNAYSTRNAYGLSVGDVFGSHVRFYHNVVRADTAIFLMDWDGGGGITLANNTFQAGRLGASTLLASIQPGVGPSYDNYFLDNNYQGFSPDMARFGNYSGNSWYGVLHTLQVHVAASDGRPLSGLTGTAVDSVDATPHAGIRAKNGGLDFILPVLRVQNQQPIKTYAPYRITLHAAGCMSASLELPSLPDQPLQEQMQCSAPSH